MPAMDPLADPPAIGLPTRNDPPVEVVTVPHDDAPRADPPPSIAMELFPMDTAAMEWNFPVLDLGDWTLNETTGPMFPSDSCEPPLFDVPFNVWEDLQLEEDMIGLQQANPNMQPEPQAVTAFNPIRQEMPMMVAYAEAMAPVTSEARFLALVAERGTHLPLEVVQGLYDTFRASQPAASAGTGEEDCDPIILD